MQDLRDELGDLLLQVVFHTRELPKKMAISISAASSRQLRKR